MEFDQSVRQQWRRIRARIAEWRTHAGVSAGRAADAGREALDLPRAGLIARVCLGAALVLFVLYPLLAFLHSTIDDDPNFGPKALKPGMSHAVAASAALIGRETNKHGWKANAPWFSPNALLDNMPNYQKGIVEALGRFALEMTDRIGRAHGAADPDLQTAAGLLQYPPDVWVWNPSVSLWPTATSESQYRQAAKALRQYNRRLGMGQAAFDRGASTLQVTLDHIAADLGSSSVAIQDHIDKTSGFPLESRTDDIFYTVKGQMYAYYIVLKGLRADFAPVIAKRDLTKPWAGMMESFRAGIALEPTVVLDGAPDSDFFACTLCGEGFYLLRARAQLREIEDILRQ
jgi:hypothetical protein